MARCLTPYWPSCFILDIDRPRDSNLSDKFSTYSSPWNSDRRESRAISFIWPFRPWVFRDEIIVTEWAKPNPASWAEIIGNDPDFEEEFQRIISDKDLSEADNSFTPDSYDSYLQMELAFYRGDNSPSFAKVTKRLRDAQGLPIGAANDNPILDTCMYEVE